MLVYYLTNTLVNRYLNKWGEDLAGAPSMLVSHRGGRSRLPPDGRRRERDEETAGVSVGPPAASRRSPSRRILCSLRCRHFLARDHSPHRRARYDGCRSTARGTRESLACAVIYRNCETKGNYPVTSRMAFGRLYTLA